MNLIFICKASKFLDFYCPYTKSQPTKFKIWRSQTGPSKGVCHNNLHE